MFCLLMMVWSTSACNLIDKINNAFCHALSNDMMAEDIMYLNRCTQWAARLGIQVHCELLLALLGSLPEEEFKYSQLPPSLKIYSIFLYIFLTESWKKCLEPCIFLEWWPPRECNSVSTCELDMMVSHRFKALSCTPVALLLGNHAEASSWSCTLRPCLLPAVVYEWLPFALGTNYIRLWKWESLKGLFCWAYFLLKSLANGLIKTVILTEISNRNSQTSTTSV